MRKHFMQAIAVTVSSMLSIGVMIAMTANAFATDGVTDNRDIADLTKPDGSPYYEEETTEEPITTVPEEEDIDPMYLHSVTIYQPSVSNQGASVYSMSFLPDYGGVFTATIPDFGGSDDLYELMVHRTTWIYPADDWIGDKNGNNIGFYARTKGTITIYYDESTDDIWVEGPGVEMSEAYYRLHDSIYGSPESTTAPAEYTTAPMTEPVTVIKKGDVDNDGIISISDATLIQFALAELTTLTEEQENAADINESCLVDIDDATAIQMFLADLIPGL